VQRVASVEPFHRAKRLVGRAQHLQGHCYIFAAHLYSMAQKQWASALVGALLYVKGRSIPQLVGELARQLRLPAQVRHVWVVDRGIASRPRVAVLRPYRSRCAGVRALKSGLLLCAASSAQAGPASELRAEVPRGPVGEAYAFAVAMPDGHPESTRERAHRAYL